MGWMGDRDESSSSPSSHTSPPSQGESPTSGRKRKITRTRTGCQTCRDRKVKCGEEKPQCANCVRTNHVCPGYAPPDVYRRGSKAEGERRGVPWRGRWANVDSMEQEREDTSLSSLQALKLF